MVTVPLRLSSPPVDLDDVLFVAVELAALALIIGYAWWWRPREQ